MSSGLRSFLSSAMGRKRFENEMQEELQDHLRTRIDHLISYGVPRHDAERQAHREFGAVAAVKEECRESHGLAWLDSLQRDLRFAFRILRKSPAFTWTAIVTLALCIGANTAIFSVVDAALFRPMPYPEPEKLAMVSRRVHSPQSEFEATNQNGSAWEFLRDNVRSLDLALATLGLGVSAGGQGVNLALSDSQAVYVKQGRVSAGFLRTLGVRPMLGREFDPSEDRPGGPALVVLSDPMWRTVFAADPSILGRRVTLRGEPYTVIGVMPASFTPLLPADVWTPLRPTTDGEGAGTNYSMIARVRPGYTWEQADAELENLSVTFYASQKLPDGVHVQFHLLSAQRGLSDSIRRPVFLLWAAVGLVLLIGCVNVAGLMLARGGARRHEIATRMALGSARAAITRQLLVESLFLAIAGGCLGLLLGYGAITALGPSLADALGIVQPATIDLRVALLTLGVTLLTVVVFGLYPSMSLTRLDVRSALASAGRTASANRGRARQVLVICEVALGVVLLAAAGLVLRTLSYLTHLDPGLDPRNVITASLSLQDARYSSSEAVNRLFDASLAKIRENPGVEAAGVGLTLPYERALNEPTKIDDGPRASAERFNTNMIYITPGFFEALHMRPISGRLFDPRDRPGTPWVKIVNEAFARRYFRDDNPVGRHLNGAEIVGVVADTQQKAGWGDFGPVGRVPTVYIPAAQTTPKAFTLVHSWFTPQWVVRTRGPQPDIAGVMRAAVASVDPLVPFAKFRSMDTIRQSSLNRERTETILFGALAGLALLLASVGIYGLIAQSIVERTREFGIRMALGSSASKAMGSAARQGVVLAIVGVALGCGLALASGRWIKALIYGVQPNDPTVFGAVVLALLTVAALASLIPSLRVARINPADTLRAE